MVTLSLLLSMLKDLLNILTSMI